MRTFKRLERTDIYSGKIINLVKDKLQTPDGKIVDWELFLHHGAAAIVPIDKNGKILLVKQYRNAADSTVLEIPAGRLEKGEDPKACAKRELEEETGYRSDDVEFLIDFYPAIGYSNEIIYVYVAKNLIKSKQHLDEDEFVEVKKFTLNEVVDMIVNGTIKDSKTITAILSYKNKYGL